MRKEIKNNNKMALALVVVAALAMISVAAIAVEDNDAAGTYWIMGTDNKLIIDETSAVNYNFITTSTEAVCPIIITENGKYSGTLSIGVLDGLNFTPYASMKLTDASNVNLTAIFVNTPVTDGPIAVFMVGNMSDEAEIVSGAYSLKSGAPAGTYELTQGQVILGSGTMNTVWTPGTISGLMNVTGISTILSGASFTSFNGTVTAGGFSLKSEYSLGAILSLKDTKALLSGDAFGKINSIAGAPASFVYPTAKLSFSGEASIQYPVAFQTAMDKNGFVPTVTFATDGILATVESGAVITAGDATPTLALSVTVGIANVDKAWLVDSKGAIAGVPGAANVVFSGVPFGSYTLVLTTTLGDVYRGTVSVSSTAVGVGGNSLAASMTAMAVGGFTVDANDNVWYDKSLYTYSYAFNLTTGEVGKSATDPVTGDALIQFPSGAAAIANGAAATDEILTVMGNRTVPGSTVCFVGLADSAVVNAYATAPPLSSVTGTVVVPNVNIVYQVKDDSKIVVKGDMKFLYTSATQNGVLDLITVGADIDAEGNGTVSHEIALYPAAGNLPAEVPRVYNTNLSTAYYFVNDADKSKATYYFTSLENAMKKSKVVYLTGTTVILEDTTFSNPDGDLDVILTPGAKLIVGDANHSPTLTIPGTTEVIVNDPGAFIVESGKAVFDVKPSGNDEPIADILIEGDKFIYTDIAAALEMAKSGDVLELQRDAELKRDAAVKDGVELKDSPGAKLTIPKEKTLTVDGKLTTNNEIIIKGTLRVNKTADFNNAAVTLDGTIDVTATGTVNFTNVLLTGNGEGVLAVNGKTNLVNSDLEVADLVVEGTATLSVDSTSLLTVTKTMRVAKAPSVSTDNKNETTISGKVTLDINAVATVYGQKDLTSNLEPAADVVKVQYFIDGVLYVTKFCNKNNTAVPPVGDIPMLYEDQLKDIIILNWNTDRMFRGQWLVDESTGVTNTVAIGTTGWESLYAKFEPRMYDVTLAYTPGVTWTVNSVEKSGTIPIAYGSKIVVKAHVQPGYEGTPSVTVNGRTYDGKAWEVTDKAEFAVTDGSVKLAGSGKGDDGGLTLIEILLIIIVIIIAIIAIIIAIRLLRS